MLHSPPVSRPRLSRLAWLCAGYLLCASSLAQAEAPKASADAGAAAPAPATDAEAQPVETEATAEPAAEVPPPAAPEPADTPHTQDVLSERVDALMDRMVRARTRIAALGEALFKTRVELYVDNRVDDHRVLRVRLFLDGAPVHDSEGKELTQGERARLYSGYAAPGMHELAVEVEQASEEDDRYQYTLAQRFRFRVPENQVTEARIRFDDDSDIAEDFEDDEDGEYDVRTRVRVLTRELGES